LVLSVVDAIFFQVCEHVACVWCSCPRDLAHLQYYIQWIEVSMQNQWWYLGFMLWLQEVVFVPCVLVKKKLIGFLTLLMSTSIVFAGRSAWKVGRRGPEMGNGVYNPSHCVQITSNIQGTPPQCDQWHLCVSTPMPSSVL
jgi:hypothetical protein